MSASAACSITARTLAASQSLSPIRVLSIPHLVPYNLGTALQEHLYQRRIDARAFLNELPAPSPASQSSASADAAGPSSSRKDDGGREAVARRVASTDHLLLLQHAPVFTEGKRKKEMDAELAGACRRLGVDYVLARRGGLITYHGVGQITGYPALDLAPMDLSVKCYVSFLEKVFRSLLASEPFCLPTVEPPEGNTGIWSDEYHKIVALGVQVRHRLTLDGFGFNVSEAPLDFFRMIVACGIQGRYVTSLWSELRKKAEAEAGPQTTSSRSESSDSSALRPSIASLSPIISEHFGRQFGRTMENVQDGEVEYELEDSSVWNDEHGTPIHKLRSLTLYGDKILPLDTP